MRPLPILRTLIRFLTLRRDVKDLGSSLDCGLLIGRIYLVQMLGALANDVYGPAGHFKAVTCCGAANIEPRRGSAVVKSNARRGSRLEPGD